MTRAQSTVGMVAVAARSNKQFDAEIMTAMPGLKFDDRDYFGAAVLVSGFWRLLTSPAGHGLYISANSKQSSLPWLGVNDFWSAPHIRAYADALTAEGASDLASIFNDWLIYNYGSNDIGLTTEVLMDRAEQRLAARLTPDMERTDTTPRKLTEQQEQDFTFGSDLKKRVAAERRRKEEEKRAAEEVARKERERIKQATALATELEELELMQNPNAGTW